MITIIEVLIVEDDPMVAELNRRYLERIEGFVLVGIVKSGEEALTFLRKTPVKLVLLDIFMPGMSGSELLTDIRREQLSVDVILVTAARDNRSVQTALRQGAVDYLIKPFEFNRFQAALLAFKARLDLMETQQSLCQHDLDEQIFSKNNSSVDVELPKGLHRDTIKQVWRRILETDGEFTAEEMARSVGISQVSMRKYLKYLQQANCLNITISYGAIGRPVYKYHCIDDSNPEFL